MKRRHILTVIAVLIGLVVLALGVFIARFDANRYKPQLIELVREHTGRTLRIDGELSLSLWPQLGLSAGAAVLSNGDGSGEALRLDSGRVALALQPLLFRQLVIEGLEVQGLRTGGPDAGWRLEQARLKTGRIASGEAGALELDGQLMSPGDPAAPLELELRSNYLADFAQERIGLDGLKLLLHGVRGEFAGLQARLSGDFQMDLRARRLEGQALTIESALPGGAELLLAGGLALDLAANSARLGLEGNLDNSALRMQADATSLEPLVLRYTLKADQIHVERLRSRLAAPSAAAGAEPPPPQPSQAKPAAPTGPGPTPAPTWPLASIGAVDTEGSIEIGRLEVSGLTVETIAATARSGGNQLALDPLVGRLNGGDLHAVLTLTSEGHGLKASLSGVDAGGLIRDAAQRDLLEGRGEVSLDLRAQGETAETLRSSLSGRASLSLREGAVKGIDLDRLMQAVRVALDGRLPIEQAATTGAQTAFSSLGGSFEIAQGVARSSNLALQADWVTASGEGHVDLNAKTLDWLVRASLVSPKGESAGQARSSRADSLARLQGIAVPIKVSGPFDNIRYRVEVQDLLGDAAKREITRRIEEKLGERLGLPAVPGVGAGDGSAKEKTLDRLRDLFRR